MTDQWHQSRDAGDHLSEPEFEQAEDRLDDMSRPRGVTRSAWQRHQKHSLLGAALVFAVLISAVVVIGGGGDSSSNLPSCKAGTHECRETANGYWVPLWYFGALSLAQGPSGPPSTTGTQPSASQLHQAGATPDEADEAESYGESANSSDGSSDDSGSGDSDDSGSGDSDDDSGGDDGGGD